MNKSCEILFDIIILPFFHLYNFIFPRIFTVLIEPNTFTYSKNINVMFKIIYKIITYI